jgi:hypothetical protein
MKMLKIETRVSEELWDIVLEHFDSALAPAGVHHSVIHNQAVTTFLVNEVPAEERERIDRIEGIAMAFDEDISISGTVFVCRN